MKLSMGSLTQSLQEHPIRVGRSLPFVLMINGEWPLGEWNGHNATTAPSP
jgi:hypothetical protein